MVLAYTSGMAKGKEHRGHNHDTWGPAAYGQQPRVTVDVSKEPLTVELDSA